MIFPNIHSNPNKVDNLQGRGVEENSPSKEGFVGPICAHLLSTNLKHKQWQTQEQQGAEAHWYCLTIQSSRLRDLVSHSINDIT
jgi:hypothetical protein